MIEYVITFSLNVLYSKLSQKIALPSYTNKLYLHHGPASGKFGYHGMMMAKLCLKRFDCVSYAQELNLGHLMKYKAGCLLVQLKCKANKTIISKIKIKE